MFTAGPEDFINYGQALPPPSLSNVVSIAAAQLFSLALVADRLVLSIQLTNQKPAVQFHTFSGRTYSVEYSTNINSTNWNSLSGGTVAGNGLNLQIVDTNTPSAAARFYRVKQSP